jgi:hypothetical protein
MLLNYRQSGNAYRHSSLKARIYLINYYECLQFILLITWESDLVRL